MSRSDLCHFQKKGFILSSLSISDNHTDLGIKCLQDGWVKICKEAGSLYFHLKSQLLTGIIHIELLDEQEVHFYDVEPLGLFVMAASITLINTHGVLRFSGKTCFVGLWLDKLYPWLNWIFKLTVNKICTTLSWVFYCYLLIPVHSFIPQKYMEGLQCARCHAR